MPGMKLSWQNHFRQIQENGSISSAGFAKSLSGANELYNSWPFGAHVDVETLYLWRRLNQELDLTLITEGE